MVGKIMKYRDRTCPQCKTANCKYNDRCIKCHAPLTGIRIWFQTRQEFVCDAVRSMWGDMNLAGKILLFPFVVAVFIILCLFAPLMKIE